MKHLISAAETNPAAVDPNALHYQEILFSIVMSVVAVIGRENPLVSSPEILWAFAGMLLFNLSYHRLLRASGGAIVPLVSMSVNVALISAVLAFSGGEQSSFWPLYLLPVFTACLHLERRHVYGAWAAASAFLFCFYIEAFWSMRVWSACELLIKLGVLGFSAAVTAHLSFKERELRVQAALTRERMDSLARSLERRSAHDLRVMKKQSLDALVPAVAHALNNPLAVVIGTAELLLREVPGDSPLRPDLERIRFAAQRCAQFGEDLAAFAYVEVEEAA